MLTEKIAIEFTFNLVKKEQTKNIHGDPFLALHFRVDMPGRTLFLEPVYVGCHAIDKLDETYLRTLLVDAMPWRVAGQLDIATVAACAKMARERAGDAVEGDQLDEFAAELEVIAKAGRLP